MAKDTRMFTFFMGRHGDPISRHDNGKVVIVDRESCLFPEPGETWEVSLVRDLRGAYIVLPIRKIENTPEVERKQIEIEEPAPRRSSKKKSKSKAKKRDEKRLVGLQALAEVNAEAK